MANGKLVLGKQSGGTLGLVFPDGVSNTEVVLPESGELVTKDYADLKVALADFTGTNVSLASSGYQKLPGGLIIQWGRTGPVTKASSVNVTFPIAFPSACIASSGIAIVGADSNGSVVNNVGYPTVVGMTVRNGDSDTNYDSTFWQAIGY